MSTAFADPTAPHFDAPQNGCLLANSSPPCLLGSSITTDVLSSEPETGKCTKRAAASGEHCRQGNVLLTSRSDSDSAEYSRTGRKASRADETGRDSDLAGITKE